MPPSPFHALPKPRAVAVILSTSTCGHLETYTRAVVDDQAPPAAFLFTPRDAGALPVWQMWCQVLGGTATTPILKPPV